MLRRRPTDDPRRRYATFLQLGLAGALGLSVAAFTVPFGPDTPELFVASDAAAPLVLDEIPPTAITPPPPTPALPPPPVAVPDEVEVASILESLDLRLDETLPPPVLPPPARPLLAPPVLPPTPPTPPPTLLPPVPPTPPAVEIPEDRVFDVVEQQPELTGGLDGLQRRVVYPRLARDAGISGRVLVQFVVDERGNVIDPVVTRTPSGLLSAAALEAVLQSTFIPGSQRGRPVKVRYSLPVHFVLR